MPRSNWIQKKYLTLSDLVLLLAKIIPPKNTESSFFEHHGIVQIFQPKSKKLGRSGGLNGRSCDLYRDLLPFRLHSSVGNAEQSPPRPHLPMGNDPRHVFHRYYLGLIASDFLRLFPESKPNLDVENKGTSWLIHEALLICSLASRKREKEEFLCVPVCVLVYFFRFRLSLWSSVLFFISHDCLVVWSLWRFEQCGCR